MPMPMLNEDITTQRTLLRKYEPTDQAEMIRLFMDKLVNHYMGNGPCKTKHHALELFERIMQLYEKSLTDRHFEIWAIEIHKQLAGHFELKESEYTENDELEVVYMLHKVHWGQGLMPEILRAVNTHAYTINRQLIATIDPENIRTVRALEKVGITRQKWVDEGKDRTLKVWIERLSDF